MSPGAHHFEKDDHGLTSKQVEGESVCLLAYFHAWVFPPPSYTQCLKQGTDVFKILAIISAIKSVSHNYIHVCARRE